MIVCVVNSNFDELPTTRNEALKMIEKLREKAARTSEDGLPYFVKRKGKSLLAMVMYDAL